MAEQIPRERIRFSGLYAWFLALQEEGEASHQGSAGER
jgi:hypothetical protein